MEVEAFIAVAAEAIAQEKVALGHLAQVELVQELARLALLAESTKPVLANERVEGMTTAVLLSAAAVGCRDVPFRAARAQRAVAVIVGFAYWSVGGQAVEICLLEERRKGEEWRVLGCRFEQQLLGQLSRRGCRGRGRHDGGHGRGEDAIW